MAEQRGRANTWFILREPGCVPQLKGPFPPEQVKPFLVELTTFRQDALITVLRLGDDGMPDVQDGPECLEILDGRLRARAARHRARSAEAWRSPSSGRAPA